ncbi:MAG: hypothetical protein ACRDPD_30725, partial [Streptosporangiaceae bacterium]
RGYRDDFFLKVMAAVRSADPGTLSGVLARQRVHLLRELHGLAEARALTSPPAVESLLITAAELHVRADLGVVEAAEKTLTPDVLAALRSEPPRAAAESRPAAFGGDDPHGPPRAFGGNVRDDAV